METRCTARPTFTLIEEPHAGHTEPYQPDPRLSGRPDQRGRLIHHRHLHPPPDANLPAALAGAGILAGIFCGADPGSCAGVQVPGLAARPAPARRLPGGLRAGAGVLQRPVDAVGGPQRGVCLDGAGVQFGGLHRPAGVVAAQGTPGVSQTAGGFADPGGLRAGLGSPGPGRLAGQPGRYPDRGDFRAAVRGLQPDGALGLAARAEPVEHPAVHLPLCRAVAAGGQPGDGGRPAGVGGPPG